MEPLNIINNYNTEDYILEEMANKYYEGEYRERKVFEDNEDDIGRILYEMQMEDKNAQLAYNDFKIKVKDDLLYEAILYMYKPTLKERISPRTEALSKTLVKDFIQENGSEKLLKDYRNKSYLLSELFNLVNEYSDAILEKVDRNDISSFVIDTDLKDDFFNTLETEDFQSISTLVNQRIAGAIDEFIIDNQQTKAQIRDIVNQTKERIDSKQNIPQDIEEEYRDICKTDIERLKRNKIKTVLECLIFNIAESSIKNPDLREIYFKDNKPDMDMIIDESITVYSLLETLNTCKLINVNEEYIINFLNSFKR